ncbi:MAG TPA: type II toxin-antitoxin system VapC family toxin [Thermoanaerobaculia bacterium]|nr:type II toxin-antitoxin system VapC family toxin [Thermoanaerobaculia bacterium]
MILGIDTDVLVSWLVKVSPRHVDARRLIESQVRERGGLIALTPLVVQEFLHVVTDPRRFEEPLSMPEAIQRIGEIWESEEVVRILPSSEVMPRTLELLADLRLGRKRILDTALAATLESAEVRRLATFNPGDFRIFDFLELVDSPPKGPRPRLV